MFRLKGIVASLLFVCFGVLLPAPAHSAMSEAKAEGSEYDAVALPLPASVRLTSLLSPNVLAPGEGVGSPATRSGDPSAADPHDSLESPSVEWGPLLRDSLRFVLLEHAYRMPQRNTRAGFTGRFLPGYFNSVANIRGWGDGDKLATNYVGHPMQGAIAGNIWIAHDPRYRPARFRWSSSHYWKSRLRATAFSAAYSLQFEIGPLSEASLGNVQQNPKATGVVDWVITPAMGLAWMVAEDAADEKLIRKWEANTDSRAKRILFRGLLNPSRSFANILMFKPPWHRDTRPGITQF